MKAFVIKALIVLSALLLVSPVYAKPLFTKHTFGSRSAVLVTDLQGKDIFAWNVDKALVPASTIKVATGIAAVDRFGLDYRFKTDFFFTEDTLWVKGYGDPFLTSEELDNVAQSLIHQIDARFLRISRIIVDGTHFPLLKVPGRVTSTQPYDAPLAAVSANFNTIKVRKKGSVITSAESQTPITPLAKRLSAKLKNGVYRINLVRTDNSEQYFAELLAAKLKQHGFDRQLSTSTGFTPVDAELIYQHTNSKNMGDAVRAMLFYSNNFIANQLFLQMRSPNQPISFSASSDYMKLVLSNELAVGSGRANAVSKVSHEIVEGSGLSRKNKLTARQLGAMLQRFHPHKKLMKSYLSGKAYAKSGSLNGVHNLAGYISKGGREYLFTFLFNQPVPWRYRNTLLEELYATL